MGGPTVSPGIRGPGPGQRPAYPQYRPQQFGGVRPPFAQRAPQAAIMGPPGTPGYSE